VRCVLIRPYFRLLQDVIRNDRPQRGSGAIRHKLKKHSLQCNSIKCLRIIYQRNRVNFTEDPLRLVNVFLYSACVHFLRCTRCTWLFQSSHGRILGGDWGDLKQAKSIFIHPNFLQFGKQHSRYKPILSSFVLSQQCCKVYFISLAAVNPWCNET